MKWQTSKVQISRSCYQNNLHFINSILGPDTTMSSVVKGNAYGHGIETFVPLALECGLRHFSVFSANEAWRVHKCVGETPVTLMIMGMVQPEAMEWVIENGIEFFVFDLERLHTALNAAKKVGKQARIHLEIETGMNRTGLPEKELCEAIETVVENSDHLKVVGVCTHFAGAESIANYIRIEKQKSTYLRLSEIVKNSPLEVPYFHSTCSAGAIRYPEMKDKLSRVGIIQYGFWPSYETFIDYSSDLMDKTDPLSRIISWKSLVMDIKTVNRGEYIGYGNIYLAGKEMKIATIPIGYGNGYSRALSNIGRVLIKGIRTAVLGKVNMNLISIDVTGIPGVEKGDEVVLIGRQGKMEISVADFGDASKQINYELLTRLPEDLPREIVD